MKSRILFFILTLTTFSMSTIAQDRIGNGPSPVGDILTCDGEFEFVVRHTAAVRFFQGLLKISDNEYISMNCKPLSLENISESPAWDCTEIRNGDGKWIVKVETNKATQLVSANVELEQMYSLKPQSIATLNCVR
jgi:hypothetical protein